MEILSAELDDCEDIIQLQQLAYQTEAQLYQDWSIPPLTQTSESLQQEFPHITLLKAVRNKQIIGSVRAQLIDGACHIGRLIVHPDSQRQGVGSALLRYIERRFEGATNYALFTGSKSESNIRFYQREGYSITHTKILSEKVTLVYLCKQA